MYVDNPNLEKPEDENATIYRYMDFIKLLSLLDKKALFFTRVDKFNDPFEGSFSKANVELRPKYFKGIMPPNEIKTLSQFYKTFVKLTVVNCWHLSDYRMATMWQTYLRSNNGVAIRSTFGKLRNSLEYTEYKVYIGKVKYISYKSDLIPEGPLFPYFHKRRQFEDEKELRAVIQDFARKKNGEINWSKSPFNIGLYVPVCLDTLIDRVYLAPRCHQWQVELVESVMRKYGVNKEVVKSSLYDTGKIVY